MLAEIPVPQIEIIRVINPFDPRDHLRESLPWAAEKTLADYFPIGTVNSIVSINGKIINADDFALTHLAPDDNIVTCPIPMGGGGSGKNILATVAMIAVAVFAPYAAAALGPGLGIAAGTIGMSLLTVGITMAGSMLISALMAPGRSTNGTDSANGGLTSTSYGIDGPKNTSIEGIVLPVLYGEYRMAGNIVNLFVENNGDSQILYVRTVASEGTLTYLGNVELNDQPVATFTDGGIALDIRLGASTQPIMGWFADTITPHTIGTKLTTGYTTYTTGNIDEFRVDLSAPNGLFSIDTATGATSDVLVDFEVLYSVHSANNYLPIPGLSEPLGTRRAVPTVMTINSVFHSSPYGVDFDYYTNDGTVTTWKWLDGNVFGAGATYAAEAANQTITNPATLAFANANQKTVVDNGYGYVNGEYVQMSTSIVCADIPVYGILLRMRDSKRSATRKSFRSGQLTRGSYDIKIRRITSDSAVATVSDDVYVTDINEIQYEDLAMPYTAMLGVKMRLYEQLTGLPKITFLARGVAIMVNRLKRTSIEPAGRSWYWEYSANPAWIIWDILTNTRYGGGMNVARLDLVAFQEFADHCDAKSLSWNGPIDSQMNVWDACQLVARVGHAQLVGKGTGYTVVIEKASTPVMMFSVANMIEGTFKESWLPIADRANEIEVTYFDKLDGYKQRVVKVYDPAALAAGRPPRNSAITLYGVVDNARAFKEGLFQLNLNRYILQTVEFGAPMEALACNVGSLVYVQHDMPQWGYAGRFNSGCTTSVLNLDREVTMVTGTQYKVLVLHDALMRASGSITSVAGKSLFLTGFDGTKPVKRLKFGSIDREVMSTFMQSVGVYGVVLADVTSITTGAYELWDTDVMEERDVVNTNSTSTAITTQSTLTAAPGQFVHWMFGAVGKYRKPFRIKAISGSQDYRRDITAIEYNESVYDWDSTPVPTPNYSSLDLAVQQVVIDSIEENLFLVGGTFKSHVTVHFHSAQESYVRASVYVTVNSDPDLLLDADAFDRATIDLNEGDVAVFRIVPRTVIGKVGAYSLAIPTTYTVLGKTKPPANVLAMNITGQRLSWSPVSDLDLDGYQLRFQYGANFDWGSATPLHDGLVKDNFFDLVNQPNGVVVIMIKAQDGSGIQSNATASVVTSLTSPVSNILDIYDIAALGYPGTLTDCTRVSGNPTADYANSFYNSDEQSFYGEGSDSFYQANSAKEMVYITGDIYVANTLPGSIGTLNITSTGVDLEIEYRLVGPNPLYVAGPFYGESVDSFYGPPGDWLPWPGQTPVSRNVYQFRITIGAGAVRGSITALNFVVDAPDISESINDLAIGSGGTTVTYTKPFTAIKNIQVTLQTNASGAETVEVNKSSPLAPVLRAFNSSHIAVAGATADIILKGY